MSNPALVVTTSSTEKNTFGKCEAKAYYARYVHASSLPCQFYSMLDLDNILRFFHVSSSHNSCLITLWLPDNGTELFIGM